MSTEASLRTGGALRQWAVSAALFLATLLSTVYAGARNATGVGPESLSELAKGLSFGAPLMAILAAHELGHFFVARSRGVATSPPYFLPMPPQYFLIGTMGALISVRGPVRSRNVMVDFAIAGPLAGLAVSLLVLSIGIAESEVRPLETPALVEGRSLLYLAIVRIFAGSIPDGMDIFLSPTAFAGWVGLLVTMINLVPCGQLDGGHIAEAVFGAGYARFSRRVMAVLLALGIAVGAHGVLRLLSLGHPFEQATLGVGEGLPWVIWCGVQVLIERFTRGRSAEDDPQTAALVSSEPLTRSRWALVALAAVCFTLLFMPWWMRQVL